MKIKEDMGERKITKTCGSGGYMCGKSGGCRHRNVCYSLGLLENICGYGN